MAHTHTGNFPIGLRHGWGAWQRDLPQFLRFARENDFQWVELGPVSPEELQQAADAGLRVAAVDLKAWREMLSPDESRRAATVAANVEHVRASAARGVTRFLMVLAPEDPALPRAENFERAVQSYGELARAIRPEGAAGVRLVIEGAPGRPPHFGSLGCTPADCRAFFAAVAERFGDEAGAVIGLNFDPSHLVRMGIDPLRFAREFGSRIYHVHGKDTALLTDGAYEHGNLQSATFAKGHDFGGHHWRYALPGRGAVPWSVLLGALKEAGFGGVVSVELEDEEYNGTEEGEKRGFIESRDFLASI